ncbi:MAG: hydroxyacid dehydrogenase [Lachnospiraceae bacterium]|nr:hydroxyacid dehydrogenase [Lachnospiraceae bacterium]
MKIVILERNSIGLDIPMDVYEKHGDVEYYANTVTNEEVKERIKDADAVIANKAPLNAENLSGAKNVRFIGELATGFDNIDIGYCREKGIRVSNVKDYSTAMVAQHTFTLALPLLQKLFHYDKYVKSGEYASQDRFSNFDEAFCELDGKTWGIVGMGNIGSKVAKIAEAFGCTVITHSLTGNKNPYGYENVGKDELLERSDVLSLHCPLSDLSRNYIDEAALKKMKNTAVLINVARGPVIDTKALYDALTGGEIAAAGLDVLDKEPLEKDSPLSSIKDSNKLIITPHLAWASTEARKRLADEVYKNFTAFLEGKERNAVC